MLAALIAAALLWGVTNPFLKRHSAVRLSDRRAAPRCGGSGLLAELYAALTRVAFVGPFILNQCGSLAFTYALSTTDLYIAVPVANAMTFAVTSVTATLIGEKSGLPRSRASLCFQQVCTPRVPRAHVSPPIRTVARRPDVRTRLHARRRVALPRRRLTQRSLVPSSRSLPFSTTIPRA